MSINRRSGHLQDAAPPGGADERRASCRYAVAAARGWIGWWEGPQFRHVAAAIEDVSLRGARLSVERFPPAGQPVWFRPPGGVSDEWLEVRIIEAKKRLFGPAPALDRVPQDVPLRAVQGRRLRPRRRRRRAAQGPGAEEDHGW